MKKTLLTKTLLLLFALIAGSSSVWAATKTEGFETKAASTTYNSTVKIAADESDCDIAWSIYYGTVSTNDKISGTKSAQMRWYSSAKENIPYIMTTTPIDGLTNVTLKARTSNLYVKMDVCYSANGTSWTVGKTHTFTATGTGENVSLDIPSGNKYVKFEVSSSSTAPTEGNYKLIVDDVVFTYSSTTVDATWSLNPASAVVVAGQSTDLQLTTNYDGTLIFVSDDPLIATPSYNTTTKVITITAGATTGTTTISVTGAATATYSAINKTINVTVKHAELESNAIDEFGPLGYSYFGMTPEGSNAYTEAVAAGRSDYHGVDFLFNRGGESNTKLRFDADYMRFYKGNTLTVTAPAGATLRKIIFKEPATGKAWAGSMSLDGTAYGEYVSEEKTWYATSDDITSVKFTNDATKRIASIEIYLQVEPISVTIGTSGYATLAGFDLDPLKATPVGELETYVVTGVSGSAVTLEEIPHIPAGEGVILKGTPGTTYTIPVFQHGYTVSTNLLKISDGNVKGGDGIYALAEKSGTVGFYKVAAGVTIPAGKCYLNTAAGAPDFLGFGGDATGIDEVRGKTEEVRGEFYNLAGQRVAQPTKGLYIVNGKKVVMK